MAKMVLAMVVRGLPDSENGETWPPAFAATAIIVTSSVAGFRRSRFIHGQSPTLECGPVQRRDRPFGLFGRRHLHQAEAPQLSGVLVGDDTHRVHLAMRGKQCKNTAHGERLVSA